MYVMLYLLCVMGLFGAYPVGAQDAHSTQEHAVEEPEQKTEVNTADQAADDHVHATPISHEAQSNEHADVPEQPVTPSDQVSDTVQPTQMDLVSQEQSQQSPIQKPSVPAQPEMSKVAPAAVPSTPKAPEPSTAQTEQPQKSATEKIELEEIKGINTVDLDEPRGNWLFKRIWWERAEQKYEKIRILVEKLLDSRMEFFEKRTAFDKQVIEFYHDIGLDQGGLRANIDQLISQLQKAREREGSLSLEDRDMMQQLLDEKKSIEQLQAYVMMITQLDREFDTSLHTLLEQMNAVRRYEQDAWKNFKEIARVLSDTKARELYYGMDVAFSNIQEVQEYLQEPFKEHIDHVAAMMTTHIQSIKDSVEKLKEKGIDLTAQVESKESISCVKPQELQQEEEEQEPQGWIGWTFSSIATGFHLMWDSIVSVVTWPYRKLVGSSQNTEAEGDEEESESEEQPEASGE